MRNRPERRLGRYVAGCNLREGDVVSYGRSRDIMTVRRGDHGGLELVAKNGWTGVVFPDDLYRLRSEA